MLVRNLTLKCVRCGRESLHWDLLMQVTNLKTETCLGWLETWYADMVKTITNLTLRLTLGRILTFSQNNSHWDLLMLVKTLKWDLLMLVNAVEKPYIGTYTWWLETLHWLMLVTNFALDLLMLVTNLTLEHTYCMLMRTLTLNLVHAGIKPHIRTCS